MSLAYKYRKARAFIGGLNKEEQEELRGLCVKIQQAEKQLKSVAKNAFAYCYTKCQGLCCRNIQPDAILTLQDFVYVLALKPSLGNKIAKCLKNEPLYSADCLFLADGEGPCLFLPFLMPETCINSFCSNHRGVNQEIRRVRARFRRLFWFIQWCPIKRFFHLLLPGQMN